MPENLFGVRGEMYMDDRSNTSQVCRNIFKDGGSDTTVEQYTAAWIRLINLLEKANNTSAETKKDRKSIRQGGAG